MRKRVFYFSMLLLALALIALDFWTKELAISRLKEQSDIILISGILQFHYLENTGAAFSILKGQTVIFYILTPFLCAAISYVFFKLPYESRFLPVHFCCIFLIAGAIGNFADRIRFGAVTDFIYFSLIDFPVFNVADIYVTCSMTVLFILLMFYYKEDDFERIFGKNG